MIPSLSLTVIDDPASAAELGVPVEQVAAQRQLTLTLLQQSRAVTDDALSSAPADPTGSSTPVGAPREVAELRAHVDDHHLREARLYDRYMALLEDLGT